jgi:hypothetical protein
MDKYTITLPADLRDMITAKPIRLNNWPSLTTELHTGSGLYAFWWLGEQSELTNDAMDKVQFKGPAVALEDSNGNSTTGHTLHTGTFSTSKANMLLDTQNLCLYVGKTTCIKRRIGEHLMSGTSSTAYLKPVIRKGKIFREPSYENQSVSTVFKRNYNCQFRAGMEYLFREEAKKNTDFVWEKIKEKVGITQLEICNGKGEYIERTDAFKRRFYWEDLLIGVLQPWFNLDGER